jgi:hypothetical protein
MTKAELIAALNEFDDDATVLVAIFFGETQTEVSRVLGLRFFGGWGYVRAPLIGRWLERNLGLTGFTIYIRIRRTSLGSHWGESTGWVWICGRHFRNGNRVNIFHAWEE